MDDTGGRDAPANITSNGGGHESSSSSSSSRQQQIKKNRAWELLKFFLKESGVVVSRETLKEIIYVTDETDNVLLGRPIRWQGERKRSFIQQALEVNTIGDDHTNLNWATISPYFKAIETEVEWVKEQISRGSTPPDECPLWEYTCAVVALTLKKDNWYENNRGTLNRKKEKRPLRKFMWVVFYLRCWYRLWWRRSAMTAEKDPDSPIWGTIEENYTFDGVRVFSMPREETRPIIEWPPTIVISALEELMMGRLVGHCQMSDIAAVSLFQDYRAGVLDRVALIVCQPVAGIPKTIYPQDERLFRELISKGKVTTSGTSVEQEEEDALVGQDDRVISVSRKIREFQQNETSKRRKMMEIEDTERPAYAPLSTRLADAKLKNATMQLVNLRLTLSQKRTHLKLLKEDELGGEQGLLDDDAKQVERLETDIADLDKQIKFSENAEILKIQLEMETEQQKAKELSMRKLLSISQSDCREAFVDKISILVDHVYFWQFPCNGLQSRSYTARHLHLKQCFFDAMVDSGKWTNEFAFLENCQQWIVSFDIGFPERESYRMDYPETKFTALDVCSSRRSIKQTKLEGFPSNNIAELYTNTEHPWYSRARIYIVHHYLVQKYPILPIDSSIFLFDLEEECCSLNRAELRNPTISRCAYDWISLRGGGYFTSDEHLKGVWCGRDILDCLICWCEMMEETYPDGADWIVYDRITAKPYILNKSVNEADGICELFRSSIDSFLSREVDHGGGGDLEG